VVIELKSATKGASLLTAWGPVLVAMMSAGR
jgi:hypothetical protein